MAGPTGEATHVEYGPNGLPAALSDSAGHISKYTYDAQGRLTSTTVDNRLIARYEYTASGRLSKALPPEGPAVEYEYNDAGNLTRIRRGQDAIATYEYDMLKRCTREKRNTGLELTYRYDAVGNMVAWQDNQGGRGQYEYDAVGRMTAKTNATGAATRYKYDPVGNLLETIGPLGDVKSGAWSAAGELAEVVEPNGDTARFEYNRAGMLAAVLRPVPAAPHTTTTRSAHWWQQPARWDKVPLDVRLRRPAHEHDRCQRPEHDVRIRPGRPAVQKAARRRQGGRLWLRPAPGNLNSVDDGAFPIRYTSDDHNRVVRIEYPAIKQSLSYTYNALGLRVLVHRPAGQDRRIRIRRVRPTCGDPDERQSIVPFRVRPQEPVDLDSIPERRGGDLAIRRRRSRPLGIKYAGEDGKTVANWSFKNDAAGNRVVVVDEANRMIRFQYDEAGQLIEENTGSDDTVKYGYLSGGNRGSWQCAGQTIRSRYDEAGRLVEAGEETFAYDANGNLLDAQRPARYHALCPRRREPARQGRAALG